MALDFYNDTEPYTGANGTYSTEYFKDRAVELINEHNRTGDPMFMFLSFQAPHQPAQVRNTYFVSQPYLKNHLEEQWLCVDAMKRWGAVVYAIPL